MDMRVVVEFLSPGMQNLNDGRCCAKVLFVTRKFKKCLGGASVHQRVKKLLIGKKQGIELSRKCKNSVEIWHVKDFCAAGINPNFLLDCLAVWTTAITAGVVMKLNVTAFCTHAGIPAKRSGLAMHDGKCGLGLDFGWIILFDILMPSIEEGLLNFEFTHDRHL